MRLHRSFACGSSLAVVVCLGVLGPGCFSDPPSSNSTSPANVGDGSAGTGPQGCAPAAGAAAPVYAPNGYYTNGAQVCTAKGEAHIFHGVDRPSLEWSSSGQDLSLHDFATMASWHANVVRIALNQDFWLSTAVNLYDPNYAGTVDQVIAWAEQVGMDVILDLHWSDRGDLTLTQAGGTFPNSTTKYVPADTPGYSVQQPMADANSITFWSQVADRYKHDGHVIFELYNEPNGISWGTWLNGGTVSGYQAVGMQQLYDAVRQTGAQNLVIAGGVSWAFDLSGVSNHRIQGYNIMYATHPYSSNDSQGQWAGAFGYLAQQDIAPVIVTEFGDTKANCTGAWDTALIAYAAKMQISWTAWAWFPGDPCSFPSLLQDLQEYNTTVQGDVVKAALMMDPPVVGPTPEAGPEAGGDGEASDAGASDAGDAGLGDGATGDATTDAGASDAADGSPIGDAGASDSASE